MFSNRSLIAIDIGSSAIKAIEVIGSGQKKLNAFGFELLPQGAVVDGAVKDRAVVENALIRVLKRSGISYKGRRAAVAVSGSGVLMKNVMIGVKDGASLEQQVFYEAEQQFAQDIQDLYMSHSVIGGPNEAGETPVLLVAARRDIVEDIIGTVRATGMRTGVVDCGTLAIANMFEYSYGAVDSMIFLANIGANLTQICLVSQGQYLFSRDISLGGAEYTRRISQALNVSFDNAESLKLSASSQDGVAPPEVTQIITELNEQMVGELSSSLNYYLSGGAAAGAAGPTHVFLVGGGSRVLGLDAAIAASMQLPVQLMNPFQRVSVGGKIPIDKMMSQSHLFGVAVGLSMRSMDDSDV